MVKIQKTVRKGNISQSAKGQGGTATAGDVRAGNATSGNEDSKTEARAEPLFDGTNRGFAVDLGDWSSSSSEEFNEVYESLICNLCKLEFHMGSDDGERYEDDDWCRCDDETDGESGTDDGGACGDETEVAATTGVRPRDVTAEADNPPRPGIARFPAEAVYPLPLKLLDSAPKSKLDHEEGLEPNFGVDGKVLNIHDFFLKIRDF